MSTLGNGLHSIDRDVYDTLDRVNWSSAKHYGKSPAHYRHQLIAPKTGDTDPKKLGRATHLSVFEPEKFRSTCVVWSDRRAGKDWEKFVDKHPDKEILTDSMHEKAIAIGQAARSSPQAMQYLGGGRGEVTLLWSYEKPVVAGVPGFSLAMKSRLDFIANCGALVDFKSTRDASPLGFGREAARLLYHGQGAIYSDGYESLTGKRLPYVIVATESFEPYVTQVYLLTSEQLALGREIYKTLLDGIAMSRRESEWPGYASSELELVLPRWAVPEDDESAEGLDLVVNE